MTSTSRTAVTDGVFAVALGLGATVQASAGTPRSVYLTTGFQRELNAWEEKNHANGVLRAQNVPLAWKITDNSTADYTEAVITLTWSHFSTTRLVVDMTRGSHKIFHIGEQGTGGK